MFKYIKKILDKLILSEKSPEKLALSIGFGNFIAWMPIIPLQTPILIALNYILGFNQTIAITTLYFINNPFTLIPIYIADYFVGSFLLEKVLKINILSCNPGWAQMFSDYLSKWVDMKYYLGTPSFCIWNLIIGGIFLGLITSLILYPLSLFIFRKIINNKQNENSSSK